ncbi:MAG: penicillin acylase family protein [Bacteroidetes bacterium]|nr:penicillin acylase family protein [Bacteroidota bacterium]MDA0980898.1 penicillin acylase family protein [Bacteroidota bacterium]
MKKIKIFLYVIAGIFLVLCVSLYLFMQTSATDYNFDISSSDISSDVRIVFDDMAVPHIYAQSEIDAMYALGYVHASERLWQMDLLRRAGGGELSELFGEDMIENDRYLRTLGMRKAAIKDAAEFEKTTSKKTKAAALAYLAGVNKFIDEEKYPVEYKFLVATPKAFKIEDMYKTAGFMAYSFAIHIKTEPIVDWIKTNFDSTYLTDIAVGVKGFTKTPTQNSSVDITAFSDLANRLDEHLPVTQFIGSNAWVISGSKTKSGEVVFSNDTHMKYASPSVWYEAHISTPDLEYYGNHIAGVPFPPLGHTRERAWGVTMFVNDDVDLYKETIQGDRYLYDGKMLDLEISKELILVAGGENVEFEVRSTLHGPLISDSVSMWWTYMQYPDNLIQEAFYGLSRAESMEEVQHAASLVHSPGLNIMHGDIDGNIAWWAAAKLPIRSATADSKSIQDGSLAENDILGWYDFSKNPQTINPDRGFIFSTNNSPEDVDGVHYPGYYYAGNTRAATIIKALSSDKDDWTVEDSQALQMTTHSIVYESNCRMMCEYALENNFEGIYSEYFDKMKDWRGTHEKEEVEPTIYYRWMHAVIKNVFKDDLGEEKYLTFRGTIVCENTLPLVLQNVDSPWWDDQATDDVESASDIIKSAFLEAIDEILDQRGPDPSTWQYGKVHHLTHEHAMGEVEILGDFFNVGRYEVPSAKDALCKYEFKLTDSVDFEVFSGPAMRVSVDFEDVNSSESILPTGQSGNVFSPYYDNQADMYHSGEFRKQRMNKDEIEGVKIGESFIVAY